jgi:hypothetical protein
MTGAWRLKNHVIPKPASGSSPEGHSNDYGVIPKPSLQQVRELRFLSTAALKSKDSGVNEKFDCYLNHKHYICL